MRGYVRNLSVIAMALLVVAGLLLYYERVEAPTDTGGATSTASTSEAPSPSFPHGAAAKADLIIADAPKAGTTIKSPVTISGKARGDWYFEASFPVRILGSEGNVIASGPAQAQGKWMTTDFVPFSITLTFPKQPSGSRGSVILHNDNPSGDPARDDYLEVPVRF